MPKDKCLEKFVRSEENLITLRVLFTAVLLVLLVHSVNSTLSSNTLWNKTLALDLFLFLFQLFYFISILFHHKHAQMGWPHSSRVATSHEPSPHPTHASQAAPEKTNSRRIGAGQNDINFGLFQISRVN